MLTDYTPILKQNALFRGMTDAEITAAATALSAAKKRYAKGDYILHAGDTTSRLGIVLSGSAEEEILMIDHANVDLTLGNGTQYSGGCTLGADHTVAYDGNDGHFIFCIDHISVGLIL